MKTQYPIHVKYKITSKSDVPLGITGVTAPLLVKVKPSELSHL